MRRPFRSTAPAWRFISIKNPAIRLVCRAAGILLFFALAVLPGGAPPLLHAAGHIGSPAFSLDARGVPLGEVLKKVSNDTGYQIIVDSEWANWPVSGSFKNLPVDLGLRRILSHLNHSIVFNEADHRIAIVIKSSPDSERMTAGAENSANGNHPSGESHPRMADYQNSTRLRDIQAVPPEEPGETANSQGIERQVLPRHAKLDSEDVEVMPPGERVQEAVGLKGIKAKQSLQPTTALKNAELVPPEE